AMNGRYTVLTGEFYGSVDFGGSCGSFTTAGGWGVADAFVAKFDPQGVCVWAQRYGDRYEDVMHGSHFGEGVAVDPNGNVFVVGTFSNHLDFGCGEIESAEGSLDIFLAKLTNQGVCLCSQRFGDGDTQRGRAVALDMNGANSSVVITGEALGGVDFGGGWLF